jgi:uncharacterized membrane protein
MNRYQEYSNSLSNSVIAAFCVLPAFCVHLVAGCLQLQHVHLRSETLLRFRMSPQRLPSALRTCDLCVLYTVSAPVLLAEGLLPFVCFSAV